MGLGPTRRDVLKGGAAVLGAGVAQGLFSDSLLHAMTAEAACGQLTDIEHVVIFINENRSFDHYFGTYPTVRGFADPTALPGVFAQSFPQAAAPGVGDPLLPFHLVTNPPTARGECTNDISHEWNDQHVYWDNGLMDKWAAQHIAVNGPQTGPLCMGYYTRDDLTYFYALADAFTICDSYFCSVLGPTDPNRLMSMTGSIDPLGTNGGPSTTTLVSNRGSKFGKYTWPTFPEQLQKHGISWKVYGNPDGNLGDNVLAYFPAYGYNNPDPSNPYYANAFMPTFIRGSATDNFKLDAMNGTLPQVSWVLASLVDSEHPPAPVEGGELALLDVVNALTASPLWPKTALFYTYDENGGFFDHLPPPTAPAGTFAEYIPTALANSLNRVPGPVGLGFRVPMLIISPFSRGGYVSSDVFDHTSLLRSSSLSIGGGGPGAAVWCSTLISRASTWHARSKICAFDSGQSPTPTALRAPLG